MHLKVWFNILECILPGNHSKQRQSTVKKQDDAEYLLDAVYCIHFYHLSVQLYPSYKKKKIGTHLVCLLSPILYNRDQNCRNGTFLGSNKISACILMNFRTRPDQMSSP